MGKLADLVAVIDAMHDDIEGTTTLPPHRTELYSRPVALLPEYCPMLALWLDRAPWRLIATPSTYDVRPIVFVGWFVGVPEEIEQGGVGLGDAMLDALGVVDRIVSRVQTYSEGIPTLTGLYATVQETVPEREGLVFGIGHRLQIEVLT